MCCGKTEDIELDDGCFILKFPTSDVERHKGGLVRVAGLLNTDTFQPTVHYDCPENQIRSLVGRIAGKVPKVTSFGVTLLKVACSQLKRNLPKTSADPFDEMPKRYTGSKRRRYEDAVDRVNRVGLSRNDASIKMFIKQEKFNPTSKVNPDPRAIQFRAAPYCVVLGSYLKPIEHHVYHISCANAGVPPTRNIAKGLNNVDRAYLLRQKADAFDDPVFVGLDASRFDKHVSKELLELEHAVYLASNPDSYFREILTWQLTNKCFSNLGLVYKVRGRRMSGDMNTAVGNCLIMLMMLIAYCTHMQLRKWDCLDDGDDVVLIIERSSLHKLDNLFETFLHFGMEMKIECITDNIHKVLFCKTHIVEFSPGRLKFVRDFRSVISTAISGTRHWSSVRYRTRVIHSIGVCELILNLGVPVLQEFAICLLRNSGKQAIDLTLVPEGMRLSVIRDLRKLGVAIENVRPQVIQHCSRESFAIAFDFTISEQLALEKRLASWTFNIGGPDAKRNELIPEVWEYTPTQEEIYGK